MIIIIASIIVIAAVIVGALTYNGVFTDKDKDGIPDASAKVKKKVSKKNKKS